MPLCNWLKRRRPDDEDLREEIRSHLEIAADERVADGADRHSARLSSLKEFGNVTLTTEAGPIGVDSPVGRVAARSRATSATRSACSPRTLDSR